jgi:hypothetical protein
VTEIFPLGEKSDLNLSCNVPPKTGNLGKEVSETFDWWTHRENVMTGVALLHPVPSLTLYTDSSLQGWGAFLEGKSASGVWSLVQQQEHINLLEMRAVLLALQHFKTLLVSKAVVLATDNTTVVAYLQNEGGTRCHALFLRKATPVYTFSLRVFQSR